MNAEAHQPGAMPDFGSKNRRALRPFFLATVVGLATLIGWMFWPADPESKPYELSCADGEPRFYVTSVAKREMPSGLSWRQMLRWHWTEYRRRHGKPNPAAYTLPARPVQLCSISGLLNQCMEIAGTRYFIAVEIADSVEFGCTNALNGAQWVTTFERAIETSGLLNCYDFAKKRHFEDTLLLIREKPGVVKIVPRTKLAEYHKAGLIKMNSR